jgi:hypothetical protein
MTTNAQHTGVGARGLLGARSDGFELTTAVEAARRSRRLARNGD